MKSGGLSDTESIKKLIIVLLLKLGTSSNEIGLALGVDSSLIRRTFPVNKIKRIAAIRRS